MKIIRLTIEYDGTAYVGWQIQPNGLAVQQVLEEALARVLGEPVRLASSGRTDAGVHARGMVAHFATHRDLPMSAYRDGVNRFLPQDVAVREALEAEAGFHARFSARGKWYRYSICLAPVRSPLTARTSWHLRSDLDEQAMLEAAASFVGTHDFAAFRASGCDAATTVRHIYAVDLSRQDNLLHIDVKGSGFLRNMVRVMVGTLVEIGQGKMRVADLGQLLQGGTREGAGKTAPPQGLCLMEVWY
ncbi:MAG: tRNA pseudouridine(38-40) synthase TruA [Desulfuromonadaceae bacterium GWC2_58_13]|nr:MAG: tRNA pseudouridine(38-40) synthase TruA [Desulfuromonadaceae bacterium GWC2_58_13]